MTDQEALEIVRARVIADPGLEVVYRWVWDNTAAAIRQWTLSGPDHARLARNAQERARRVYMRELAASDDPIPERAARVAMDAVEAFNCPFAY